LLHSLILSEPTTVQLD